MQHNEWVERVKIITNNSVKQELKIEYYRTNIYKPTNSIFKIKIKLCHKVLNKNGTNIKNHVWMYIVDINIIIYLCILKHPSA